MTQRERFYKLFRGEAVDRLPVYYFGTWHETKALWKQKGIDVPEISVDYGPEFPGMDEDWERGMWDCHGIVNMFPIVRGENIVLEETETYRVVRYATGAVWKHAKGGATIDQMLEPGLVGTRESWEKYKSYLDPEEPARYAKDGAEKIAALARRTRVATFMAGSLYGWLRDWMGVEGLSCLFYDDPKLAKEMIDYLADYFIRLYRPFVKECDFDFAYIFEDCCGANGPLFSPHTYRELFSDAYARLISFYKEECSIPFVLLDSDGWCDPLIPCWLESGVDILFPLEVGVWNNTPAKIRAKYGEKVSLMGGIDKHKLSLPEDALAEYLSGLENEVRRGRFLPIPDHRIPPEVTVEDMKRYIRVFKKVFNGEEA